MYGLFKPILRNWWIRVWNSTEQQNRNLKLYKCVGNAVTTSVITAIMNEWDLT
jgi:hypothetical protein